MATGEGLYAAHARRVVVWPTRVDPDGAAGPTYGQARGARWRRTSNGMYVPAEVDGSVPEQRIIEAAAVLPEFGGVTGWAALRWSGGVWFGGLEPDGRTALPVVLATGYSDIRGQRGIVVTQERLGPCELVEVDGVRTTTGVRSLCFEMRYARSEREAAVHVGMAAYSDLVSVAEIALYVGAHPGWTGIPQARKSLPLTDENCWSPQETRMRHHWIVDAGLPPPLCNRPVFDRFGHHVGTPDLLDPEAGLVLEYDGAHHLDAGQRRHDRNREEAFRRVGLEYFTMLAGDSANRHVLAERMTEARDRAKWLAEDRRDWTVDLPRWWIPTFTVDQRRNLDDTQRARLLRTRGAQ